MSGPRFSALPPDAIKDRRLLDTDRDVLNDLGLHADTRTGWCFRAQKSLAEAVGVSRRTAQRSLDRLVEFGYLDRELRLEKGRGQKSNLYRVLFDISGRRGQLELFEGADAASPMALKRVQTVRSATHPPRHAHGVNDAPPASCAGGKWRTLERPSLNDSCSAAREAANDHRASERVLSRPETKAGAALPIDAGAVPNVAASEADAVPFLASAGSVSRDREASRDLEHRLRDAAGSAVSEISASLFDLSAVYRWMQAGCDLDRDILPAIAGRAARHRGQPIQTWAYFEACVLEAYQRRIALVGAMALPSTKVVPFDGRTSTSDGFRAAFAHRRAREASAGVDASVGGPSAGRFAAAAALRRSEFSTASDASEQNIPPKRRGKLSGGFDYWRDQLKEPEGEDAVTIEGTVSKGSA